MTSSLRAAFASASPRITARPVPLISLLIYVGVVALWVALLSRALSLDNVWAWSAGIAYILYDTVLMLLVAWQTLPLAAGGLRSAADAHLAPMHDARSLRLAVVIAARNETINLPYALAAILPQTNPGDVILIADNGSTDGTADMLFARYQLPTAAIGTISARSSTHPALCWLRLAQSGKAQALNAAIVATDADIVVTLDADTYLMDGALEEIRLAFARDPSLVTAGGVLVPICNRTVSGRVMQFFQTYEYIRNVISRFAWMRSNSLLLISGAFAGFRRDALLAVGGFDEQSLVEDYELSHRMHRFAIDHGLSWRLQMVGTALAQTEAPSDLPTFLRQRRRWFAGFLQTQYWNRDMTGNRRYGALGMQMLPIKALDTLQPIYGLAAFGLLIVLLVTGKINIAVPVFGIITAKIAADFLLYMWTIHLYRRVTDGRTDASFGAAFIAAVLEPFSFQLLRHAGAAWGWIAFLRGSRAWGVGNRAGSAAAELGSPAE